MTKPNKGGAPKRNRNAAKGDKNRVTLAVRVTPEAKAVIKAAADDQGISMGDLVIQWATAHHAATSGSPGGAGRE